MYTPFFYTKIVNIKVYKFISEVFPKDQLFQLF